MGYSFAYQHFENWDKVRATCTKHNKTRIMGTEDSFCFFKVFTRWFEMFPNDCRLRVAHFSAYDKNVDEEMHPDSVPDDVIQPHINNYWAPHPQTGVFGPIDHITSDHQHQPSPAAAAADGSVLEQQAWFRPLEDVDKPTPPWMKAPRPLLCFY